MWKLFVHHHNVAYFWDNQTACFFRNFFVMWTIHDDIDNHRVKDNDGTISEDIVLYQLFYILIFAFLIFATP